MDAFSVRSTVVADSTLSQEVYSDVRQAPKVQRTKLIHEESETCRVCGDGHARMHYGVLTCFGCKGFFRRTLKRPTEYSCRHQGNCIVDRHERNSCRYCRFKRCLEVGMDPKAVRPDRDATGRHYQTRARRAKLFNGESAIEEAPVGDDWSRKLPVDMRTTLMQLMNVELMVNNGDTHCNAKEIYPLPYTSLRQILDDPSLLDGKRTEMRYEAYRRVECDELIAIAHRRLIAIIDWVDHLFQIMELNTTDDKLALVKNGFAPLTIFSFAAQTAKSTRENDIMCLCNFGYVPRYVHRIFNEPYHLANRIIDRALDELVEPFRLLNLNDEEIVLLKAIVVLNPHLKSLSQEASEQIGDLRDRIQETLYHVVRETHPKEVASSRFGNLLLFLPTIIILGNVMYENLQFVQSFGRQNIDSLLCELLDNIEAVDDRGIFLHSTDSCSDSSSTPYNTVKPSSSCSSISSLTSHTSLSSFESQTHSDEAHNDSESESFRVSLPISYAHTSLASLDVNGVSNTVSLPNLDQVGTVTESDPDYNITLTAETFSGMRQALSTTQNMDVDTHNTPPNSPEFGYTPAATPLSRPHFFIAENARTTMFEPTGSRHKFTVTTRITERKDETMIARNTPTQSTQVDSSSFGAFHRPQMPLSKTLSCPRPGAPSSQTQLIGLHAASVDLSNNVRTIHRRSPNIIVPSANHNESDFIDHFPQNPNDDHSSDFEGMDFY
uniref:Nuclear hormone receptor family member nhr-31 n=2 Tax=Parascaris univalens TaxID=6257 RepID=A0A915BU75_PARUN